MLPYVLQSSKVKMVCYASFIMNISCVGTCFLFHTSLYISVSIFHYPSQLLYLLWHFTCPAALAFQFLVLLVIMNDRYHKSFHFWFHISLLIFQTLTVGFSVHVTPYTGGFVSHQTLIFHNLLWIFLSAFHHAFNLS